MAKEHSELLVGLGAVRVSLEEAERRLAAAATLLDERDTGPTPNKPSATRSARLEGMMDAFAQTANEAAPEPTAAARPGAGAASRTSRSAAPRSSCWKSKCCACCKSICKQRTSEHQQRLAGSRRPAQRPAKRADLQKEAQELAAEQGRLAELVENMLTRDNER